MTPRIDELRRLVEEKTGRSTVTVSRVTFRALLDVVEAAAANRKAWKPPVDFEARKRTDAELDAALAALDGGKS